MKKIGFSHGVLYRILDVYSKKAIDTYKNCGANAIEICINKAAEFPKLSNIAEDLKYFSYKSLHLPSDIKYKDDISTNHLLNELENIYKDLEIDLVLVHPDLVDNWKVFDRYKLNWAIENMDNRKEKYKTLDDIKNFFTIRPGWKFVLDLNHCYSNDTSMKLANDLINNFKSNIAQIHLSGYENYHEPLFQTKQNNILDYCKSIDDPIIIESTFDDINDVKKEYKYITSYLNK